MRASAVRIYGDVVQVAHVFEHLLVLFVDALANGNHEHDRTAADDHAKYRKNRTRFATQQILRA